MNTTAKTLSALLLGATLVTPAFAQSNAATPAAAPTTPVESSANGGANNNGTSNPASTDKMPLNGDINAANNAADQGTQTANSSSTAAGTASSGAGNTQMAMNTTGNAADLSSVPDTQKKYSRASRNRDFRSEAQTTKELNQKAAQLAQ